MEGRIQIKVWLPLGEIDASYLVRARLHLLKEAIFFRDHLVFEMPSLGWHVDFEKVAMAQFVEYQTSESSLLIFLLWGSTSFTNPRYITPRLHIISCHILMRGFLSLLKVVLSNKSLGLQMKPHYIWNLRYYNQDFSNDVQVHVAPNHFMSSSFTRCCVVTSGKLAHSTTYQMPPHI